MAELFDNICRILATPMPRSRALKLMLGGLAVAVLAPPAFGDNCSPSATVRCGTTPNGMPACCPNGQTCCLTPNTQDVRPVCCQSSRVCVNQVCERPSRTQP